MKTSLRWPVEVAKGNWMSLHFNFTSGVFTFFVSRNEVSSRKRNCSQRPQVKQWCEATHTLHCIVTTFIACFYMGSSPDK